jgi:hypothetical protein
MVYSCGHFKPAVYKMRIISTGNKQKVAILAASKAELDKLQRLSLLNQFNANIITQPQKSDTYQCFVVVYEFETAAQARIFRLAYAMAKKNGKLAKIKREYPSKPPRYTAASKAATRKRRLRRQRKRTKTRYLKLIPLLKAGSSRRLEEKARQIARELLIIDLL